MSRLVSALHFPLLARVDGETRITNDQSIFLFFNYLVCDSIGFELLLNQVGGFMELSHYCAVVSLLRHIASLSALVVGELAFCVFFLCFLIMTSIL